MREIKFRAWDKKCNKMYADITLDLLQMVSYSQMLNDAITYLNKNDVELQQFTGIHDKNGKEIYEGDIVSTATKENCEIIYMDKWAGFASHRKSEIGEHYSPLSIINHPERYPLKVIGNIYENSELLK